MEQNTIDEYKKKIANIELQIDEQKKILNELILSEEKRQNYKINEQNNINDIKLITKDSNMMKKINSMEEELIKKNNKDLMNFEIKKEKINKKIIDLENRKEEYQDIIKKLYLDK